MNETIDVREIGEHFLDFAIGFFNHTKEQFQQQSKVKANTLAFQVLIFLDHRGENSPTMSELAAEVGVTKQQLTKIVNDLEDQQLVSRIHDSKNRRHVYLKITSDGIQSLQQLKEYMLSSALSRLSSFTPQELQELDRCLTTLSHLMRKFHV